MGLLSVEVMKALLFLPALGKIWLWPFGAFMEDPRGVVIPAASSAPRTLRFDNLLDIGDEKITELWIDQNLGARSDHVTERWLCLVMVRVTFGYFFSPSTYPSSDLCFRRVQNYHHTLQDASMAAISNLPQSKMSRADASKMADEWEMQLTRLINDGDRVAWDAAQPQLYKDLVSSSYYGLVPD